MTLPRLRHAGKFEAVHFRGRNAVSASRYRPEATTEMRMTGEARQRDSRSCDDGMFAIELLRSAGLDPAGYRMAPLIRRLPACLRALRVPSVATARELLAKEPRKREIALHALLIGTTSFFRDAAVFQCLGEWVVQELLARQPRPRVWSAACSDGVELYSVAMLLAEHGALGPEQLLGSDCRAQSITVAQRGIYPVDTAATVPAGLAARYLIGGKSSVAVAPAIHSAARWECRDLLREDESGPWDMILCRNLAIYLEAGAVEWLWNRLTAALAPDGLLVVGKAEKPRVDGLKQIGPCIYRKAPEK
jgi:chemotaxis protein methyltransferase CheR